MYIKVRALYGGDELDIDWNDLESIIENYYQALYRYCYRMLRDKEDAEDMVQEVFINIDAILTNKRNVELHNNYIYKIAYNQCVNKIKRDKLIKFISFEGAGIEEVQYKKDTYFEDELSEELSIIMSLLKSEERSLLIFRAINDMDYKEISIIMGKSAASLRKQYERTRKKIMKILEEREGVLNERISIF